jgi:post-segregation antitoxin (ccd killing protein)
MPTEPRVQLKLYVSEEAREIVRRHARARGVSQSATVETVIQEVLAPELERAPE